MSIELFIKGLLIGISIAAPVGPMSLLCIKRTLEKGKLYGFSSGFGIALADGTYGAIAALGLTAITTILVGTKFWLGLIGGFFLIYLGVKTIITKPVDTEAKAESQNLFTAFVSIFFLTLTNPMTILSFVAILAGVGALSSENHLDSLIVVGGVFAGSLSWWLVFVSLISVIKARLKPSSLVWISKVSGIIILAFGIISLWSLVY